MYTLVLLYIYLVVITCVYKTAVLITVLSAIPIRVSLGFISLEEDSYDWDKSSPYECGFVRPKIPGDFSSRFFHLVILFLV